MVDKCDSHTASCVVRTEYQWGEVECASSLKSHFRNCTMTAKSFPPHTHTHIWMLRKDKKAWRRTDVLEVWNGLTSKPPGKNLKHEMQAPDWQELFREHSKPGSAFQAVSLCELWEACVAGRDAGREKTLSELWGNVAYRVCWCAGDGKGKAFFLIHVRTGSISYIGKERSHWCIWYEGWWKHPCIKAYLPIVMTQVFTIYA